MADAGVGSASQPCSLLFLNAIHTMMTTVS